MKRTTNTKSRKRRILSGTLYRDLVESSQVGVFSHEGGLFRYVNTSLAETFGYEVSDLVDKLSLLDLASGEDKKKLSETIRSCLAGEARENMSSFRGITKNGNIVYAELHGSLSRYKNRPAIIGTIVDDTNHFRADEVLKETLGRYRSLFEEDIAPRYVTTPGGTFADCNHAFAQLFGFSSKDEVLSVNASSLFPMPAERARFIELIKERKRLKEHKTEYVRHDGKRVYVSENAVGEFDSSGNLIGIRGYLLDETNERQLEGELFQSQRLETLGTLVGGIAHDFNNILGVIVGHVALMDKWRQNQERFSKSFEAVKKATDRGAHIVKQLLTFARKVEIVTESVRVGDIIEELVALLDETLPEKIAFRVEIDPNIPSIHADSNQLHQVLLNLCVNARDAMPNGGTIVISATTVDRGILNGHFREVETDRYVQVKVKDTGTGMDKETISHIFEPFFTTKKAGHGTGLGLSVVYGIMKAHHGFVDVKSEVGQGTTFSLYFPIPAQTVEVPREKKKEGESPRGHGEMILAIEDEESLRDFLKTFLDDNGYKVLLAEDGLKGLLTYKEHMNEVNLVILDMGLPEMSGAEVLGELKTLNPGVKVILASGYLEPEIKADAFEAGAAGFLPKPYNVEELLAKVHTALEFHHDGKDGQ